MAAKGNPLLAEAYHRFAIQFTIDVAVIILRRVLEVHMLELVSCLWSSS